MIDSTILYLMAAPIYLAVLIVVIKKQVPIQKQVLIALFFIYLIGFFSVTLFPLPVQNIVSPLSRQRFSSF
ncbi:MAG TPA: hypothetical protein VFC74_04775 [Oscillospiraceae bacterium]|nr:hypothetical protein [Oscillospiraceae bacterium]